MVKRSRLWLTAVVLLALGSLSTVAYAQGGEPGGGGGGGTPPPLVAAPCATITTPQFFPSIVHQSILQTTANETFTGQVTSCSSVAQTLTVRYDGAPVTPAGVAPPPSCVYTAFSTPIAFKPGESKGVSTTSAVPICGDIVRVTSTVLAANGTVLGSSVSYYDIIDQLPNGCCRG